MKTPLQIQAENTELKRKMTTDELHPERYCGKYECWDVMGEQLGKKKLTAFQGYLYGCAFKYLWRLGEKDDPQKEIDKCINYLNKLKENL